MFNLFKPCLQYLAFDDRRLMLFGIPIITMLMPLMLNLSEMHEDDDRYGYWVHQVPESLIFVIGFWVFYRGIIIWSRKKLPKASQAPKRITYTVLLMLISAPFLKNLFVYVNILLTICTPDHDMPDPLQALISIYLPSFLIIAVYEAVYYFKQYTNALVERERLETQHVNTELSNLRNQINPHFLFNSLNTLMNLIPTDQEAAMNYLSKLSKFYRYAVGVKEEKLIPLQKEIEFAHLFVDLLHERFKDALDVKINVQGGEGQKVPPLSLQLLIENAVKHNVVSRESPLNIEIEFDEREGELVVSNNVQRKINSVSSTGMGLENIKSRFKYFTSRPVKIIDDIERFQVALPTIGS